MARERQTDLAVLGALSIAPMSGYAVREGIRDVLGQFWSESFGQIYPALARLEADGCVVRQGGERSLFALTDRGRDRLRELLRRPVPTSPPRNGLLLRLFFGSELGPAGCRELVEAHRAAAVEALDRLAATRAGIEAEPEAEHHVYALLTVSSGEHSARAAIAWADDALARLDALPRRLSPAPGPRTPRTCGCPGG